MCWQLLSACFFLSPWPQALWVCKQLCSGVIRQEWPLRCTGPHGQVGVHQQVGEAGGEVGNKVIGDGAQSLLDLGRQLSVMVFLFKGKKGGHLQLWGFVSFKYRT